MKPAAFRIGPHAITHRVLVAPMAGITDRPFRQLCRRFGAAYAVSEMATSDPLLATSAKTRARLDHSGEDGLRAVQIVGADPQTMARAARENVAAGAQVIDINMGCPARKVCRVAAGSALMAQEALAIAIVEAVAHAVEVPVTVKLRTGPDLRQRNAGRLARAFEDAGARMLVVHGRTRACAFRGRAEHDTVAEVKTRVGIPVVANGDIDSPQEAARVLQRTGADAVMIGRAARGRPWLFRRITDYLDTGEDPGEPDDGALHALMHGHLLDHYALYGEERGVRSARKHVQWYLQARAAEADDSDGGNGGDSPASSVTQFLARFHRLDSARAQLDAIDDWFAPRSPEPVTRHAAIRTARSHGAMQHERSLLSERGGHTQSRTVFS
jgi:tRNA-dihydrouridine synthase B